VPVHIKVETGTNRQGVYGEDLLQLARAVRRHEYLQLEGLSTHYANIEDVTEHGFAELQLSRFLSAVTCSSATAFHSHQTHGMHGSGHSFPQYAFQSGARGHRPLRFVAVQRDEDQRPASWDRLNELAPVMTWKTRIAQIKMVRREQRSDMEHGSRHARFPHCRAAGGILRRIRRKLSSIGYVLIHGRRAPVRGRVCHEHGHGGRHQHTEAALEDEAVLSAGKAGIQYPPRLSRKVGSINYEFVSRINPTLPRIVV